MSVQYHPFSDPRLEIDVRACLVEAVARAIERRCGGNPVLNRLEAEACADRFISFGNQEFSRNGEGTEFAREEGSLETDIGSEAGSVRDASFGDGTEVGDLVGMNLDPEDLDGGDTEHGESSEERING